MLEVTRIYFEEGKMIIKIKGRGEASPAEW
jgi:hypothetical protein